MPGVIAIGEAIAMIVLFGGPVLAALDIAYVAALVRSLASQDAGSSGEDGAVVPSVGAAVLSGFLRLVVQVPVFFVCIASRVAGSPLEGPDAWVGSWLISAVVSYLPFHLCLVRMTGLAPATASRVSAKALVPEAAIAVLAYAMMGPSSSGFSIVGLLLPAAIYIALGSLLSKGFHPPGEPGGHDLSGGDGAPPRPSAPSLSAMLLKSAVGIPVLVAVSLLTYRYYGNLLGEGGCSHWLIGWVCSSLASSPVYCFVMRRSGTRRRDLLVTLILLSVLEILLVVSVVAIGQPRPRTPSPPW